MVCDLLLDWGQLHDYVPYSLFIDGKRQHNKAPYTRKYFIMGLRTVSEGESMTIMVGACV